MYIKSLQVKSAKSEDVYKDIVRIPESQRRSYAMSVIPEGTLCRINNGQHRDYVFVRGVADSEEALIYADERTRNSLNIQLGESYEFQLKRTGFVGRAKWSLEAADPAYRVASQIALISAGLGLMGLIFGIISLTLTLRH